jgi:exodeoxyribonuclease VII large subunit
LSSKRLVKALVHQVGQFRSRVNLARSSYVFRKPEELFRQRRQQVDDLRMRMEGNVKDAVRLARRRLDHAKRGLALLSPAARVGRAVEKLAALRHRLAHGAQGAVARNRGRLQPLVAQLDALSPLGVLARGYALAWKLPDRELVREARQLRARDELELRFGSGAAFATVKRVKD